MDKIEFIKKYIIFFFKYNALDVIQCLRKTRVLADINEFYKILKTFYLAGWYNIETIPSGQANNVFAKLNDIINNSYSESIIYLRDENISLTFKELDAITPQVISKFFIENDKFLYALIEFLESYKLFEMHTDGSIIARPMMNEFYNMLSHATRAMISPKNIIEPSDYDNNSDYDKNIRCAISHLKRGTKDIYKFMIHACIKALDNKIGDADQDYVQTRIFEFLNFGNSSTKLSIIDKLKETYKNLFHNYVVPQNKIEKFKEHLLRHIVRVSSSLKKQLT